MELLKNLFEGYPNLWGGGVAHSVLILSLVIAFGIMLGKIKIAPIANMFSVNPPFLKAEKKPGPTCKPME